jgi:hypothetical protein
MRRRAGRAAGAPPPGAAAIPLRARLLCLRADACRLGGGDGRLGGSGVIPTRAFGVVATLTVPAELDISTLSGLV